MLKLRFEAILEVEFLNDVFYFIGSIYNSEDIHILSSDVAKLVQEDFLDPCYQSLQNSEPTKMMGKGSILVV